MIFRILQVPEGYEKGMRELLEERGHVLKGHAFEETAPSEGPKGQAPAGSGDAAQEIVVSLRLEETPEKKLRVEYTGADGKEDAYTARLCACEKAFGFRALMRLVSRLEKQGIEGSFALEEEICLDRVGAMLDCSRNSVLRVETIKGYIRMEAALGMNTLMLYTEDTYEVPEYPYFGAFRGRYSSEELTEMADYAESFGIEMIPCIQALAHLKNALRWDAMKGMQDTEDILMVGDEEVYRFVEACIRSATAPFHTKRVHLGMDEAWSLGLGNYLHKNGYHSKTEIMSEHLNRVAGICRQMGLEPMIWSDMYLRMNSRDNEYYDLPLDSDLSGAVKPPENVTLVYWDYYHEDEEFYREYLRMHRQLSDKVIFAGGGWVWNGLSPNLKGAKDTTEAGIRACKAAGVREAVCTMWQDDGAETPMTAGLPAIIRFAEHAFCREVCEEQLKEQYEFLTGMSWEAGWLPGEFDRDETGEFYDNPSKCLLYQDPMLGLFDGQIREWNAGTYYAGLKRALEEACGRNLSGSTMTAGDGTAHPEGEKACGAGKGLPCSTGGNGKLAAKTAEAYLLLADALSVKAELGNRLCGAYASGDKQELLRIAREEIPACREKIRAWKDCREELWNMESRIYGFEVIDVRIGGLLARLETAQKRVTAYAMGELDCLKELEEERLAFRPRMEGEERLHCVCNNWKTIVSASPI